MEAVYQGFKIGANPFDPEKEIVFYRLQIDQDGQAVVKAFKSTSGRAARFFDALALGTKVWITRHGTGNETKYDFSLEQGEAVSTTEQDENVPF